MTGICRVAAATTAVGGTYRKASRLDRWASGTPSSRAFAIRRENGGRDFRMLPAALAAWMASAAAHQWWRWLTLMDDDPMSVTGYAIGALAVMLLLPVVLVVPSLAGTRLIRPLRASLGDAVAVMAVAGLLSAAAAVTADSVRWHDAAHVQARDGARRRGGRGAGALPGRIVDGEGFRLPG